MHSLFANLSEELAAEQRANAEMHQKFFTMMQSLQDFVMDGATQSCKNLGKLSGNLNAMHTRCIPEYSRTSYNIGIEAVNFRKERNELQKRKSIGREAAEELMRKQRLEDLTIYQDFIPEDEKPRTSRTIRTTTRQITSQLRAANLETVGAKQPLPKIGKMPSKKRDATPEVGFCCYCVFMSNHMCLCLCL